jgi:hypothetical protein
MIIAFYPGAGGNRYLQQLLGNEYKQPNRSYDSVSVGQRFQHRYLLDTVTSPLQSQHILTHCMNSQRIQQMFPDHKIVFIKSNLKTSLQREWALHGHERYMSRTVDSAVSRIEHYLAIRDPLWPIIENELQLDTLPDNIKKEVYNDYVKVTNTSGDVPGVLAQVTQRTIDKINSAYEIITWHLDYYQKYPLDFSAAEQVIDIDTDQNEFSSLIQQELNLYHSEVFNQVWDAINEQ